MKRLFDILPLVLYYSVSVVADESHVYIHKYSVLLNNANVDVSLFYFIFLVFCL